MGLNNYFVVASRNEIKLNKIVGTTNNTTTIRPRSYRNIAICTKVENIRKIDWCRDRRQDDGLVIAAGTRTGKVTLVSFPNVGYTNMEHDDAMLSMAKNSKTGGGNINDRLTSPSKHMGSASPTPYLGSITKTFVSKQRRSCVSLRWNPIKVFQVAVSRAHQVTFQCMYNNSVLCIGICLLRESNMDTI